MACCKPYTKPLIRINSIGHKYRVGMNNPKGFWISGVAGVYVGLITILCASNNHQHNRQMNIYIYNIDWSTHEP
jgi:hypothetical protein